jgi:hypothetical protein
MDAMSRHQPLKKTAALAALLLATCTAFAQPLRDYRCTIERLAGPDEDKKQLLEPRTKLYQGREFTVERRTGLMAGALKNSYVTRPEVIDLGSSENSYKVITTLRQDQGAGRGSNAYLLVINEYKQGPRKPFVYVDNDDVYFGTCVHF